jgi:Spy/CpxP family protein refolding chaperone
MKNLLLLLLLIVTPLVLMAQRGPGLSPSERVKIMDDSLSLSEAQEQKLLDLFETTQETMLTIRDNSESVEQFRSEFRSIRLQEKEKIQLYLTGEQFQKWEVLQAQRNENRRSQRKEKQNNKPD